MTYENRQTIGLLLVLLGAIVGAVGLLTFWLSERKAGAGTFVVGLAMASAGIYVIFVLGGGVPSDS